MTTDNTSSDRAQALQKLGEMIKGVRIAMMTTVTKDHHLRARPMATLEAPFEDDEYLWFFTKQHSDKVEDIEQEHQIHLSYVAPDDNLYVSISGRAVAIHDQQKAQELWSKPMEAWFPEGLDDPGLTLLRVEVEEAEYWDGPSSRMVIPAGMAQAIARGETYQPGENETLNLEK